MTYEEIDRRIADGIRPESPEAAGEELVSLAQCSGHVDQDIAIRLYDSKLLHGKKGWWEWIRDILPRYADKATFYRRCEVGAMLSHLRDSEPALFKKHVGTPVTLLENLLPLWSAKKVEDQPVSGPALLENFLRLHWQDDWTREQMIVERDRVLYPHGRTGDSGITEQMTFDFDAMTPCDESGIAAFIESKRLKPEQAGVLVANGVRLCTTALPYMTAHPEIFDEEDLPELETLRDRLEKAARQLSGIIAAQTQKALQS